MSLLVHSWRLERCMLRRGQASHRNWGRWKSFRGVLLVLLPLLCHLGQAELLGTCWAGQSWRKQIGLGYGCSGPFSQQDSVKRRDRTTQHGRSLVVPRVLVRTRTGKAPLSGHIAPLMKPWCAEGEVPTAAKMNLYRG